jgi:predicted RNA-binding Zn ribbon-like protein
VVVDLSKNRSKRFCEAGCGNRAAVTAYRARRAAAQS